MYFQKRKSIKGSRLHVRLASVDQVWDVLYVVETYVLCGNVWSTCGVSCGDLVVSHLLYSYELRALK
jgi:hypothetical protein